MSQVPYRLRYAARLIVMASTRSFKRIQRIFCFILFNEIKWVRKIINDSVEALTRKSRARFQII